MKVVKVVKVANFRDYLTQTLGKLCKKTCSDFAKLCCDQGKLWVYNSPYSTHTHTHTHTLTHTPTCMCTHVRACTHTQKYTTHAHTYVRNRLQTHAHNTHTCTHTNKHARKRMHTHTCTHTCTHTHSHPTRSRTLDQTRPPSLRLGTCCIRLVFEALHHASRWRLCISGPTLCAQKSTHTHL